MLTAFFYNFLYKPIVGSEHCFEFVYFLKEGQNRQYLNCEFLDFMRIRPVWRPSAVEREGSKVIFATVVGTNVDGATWNIFFFKYCVLPVYKNLLFFSAGKWSSRQHEATVVFVGAHQMNYFF